MITLEQPYEVTRWLASLAHVRDPGTTTPWVCEGVLKLLPENKDRVFTVMTNSIPLRFDLDLYFHTNHKWLSLVGINKLFSYNRNQKMYVSGVVAKRKIYANIYRADLVYEFLMTDFCLDGVSEVKNFSLMHQRYTHIQKPKDTSATLFLSANNIWPEV